VIADSCRLLAFRLSDAAWTLSQIGLGGYAVGYSVGKIAPKMTGIADRDPRP
jgi:F0F1-type ATP synthase membrane subunit c/vacuolar-type H+-ATPase subunit K